jgi:phosphatidylinositol alpha-1,6-mannosyltransferase
VPSTDADPDTPAPDGALPKRKTLLLAPELFGTGGIQKILQIYLKALTEFAKERDEIVGVLALNDFQMGSTDLRGYSNETLREWHVCSKSKKAFIKAGLKMARTADRIVCGHVAQLPVCFVAKLFNRRLKYYLVAHGIEVWRKFSLPERIALRGAERIFCVSNFTRTEMTRHFPPAGRRAEVVYNCLEPECAITAGLPIATCPPTILTVARLNYADRYKGIDTLIQAMPEIRRKVPNATLRVVGRGDDMKRLQNLRDHCNLGSAVQFLGYVNDDEMAEQMRGCRLFALPSKNEGFGLVFIEAMANGRPCMGASDGGVPEVISVETGVQAPFGDIPKIAEACIEGLNREWSGKAILERAESFSYSHFRRRFFSLLAE